MHTEQIASQRDQVSEVEWQIRIDLAASYRLVALYGWDDLIFSHITARIPGSEGHFLINPFGHLFEEITASSLVKVDLQGNKIDDSPAPVNKAGCLFHGSVYEGRADAMSVVHLHTLDGMAVSAMSEGLLPLNQTAIVMCGDLAYHDYGGLGPGEDEKMSLQRDLGDKNILLMRNHGTLAVGRTVGEAFMRIYAFERSCSVQVRTLAAGNNLHRPPADVVERTAKHGNDPDAAKAVVDNLIWPAFRRMLDRRDLSYRN